MPGQPQITGALTFDLVSVEAIEAGGIAPSVIINEPNNFTLSLHLAAEEPLAPLLVGEQFNVVLHAERLEDGARSNLIKGPFAVPATVPGPFVVNTTPYTTGGPGAVADFAIAAGFVASTFEITVHIHFLSTAIRPIVAAFSTIYLEVVT